MPELGGPSPWLSYLELSCKDEARTPYPREWRETRLPALVDAFEAIRAEYGKPIRILSAYRTEKHNRAVGGARLSQHVQGRALDLAPLSMVSLPRLIACVEQVARQGKTAIRGIGIYPSFVHVDVRLTDSIARWGDGLKGRQKADVD